MITQEELQELNILSCPVHNETPRATIDGEDINYKHCCPEFESTIKAFVREKVLGTLQNITREKFGLE